MAPSCLTPPADAKVLGCHRLVLEHVEVEHDPYSVERELGLWLELNAAGAPNSFELSTGLARLLGARVHSKSRHIGAITEMLLGAWDAAEAGACPDFAGYEVKAKAAGNRIKVGGLSSVAEWQPQGRVLLAERMGQTKNGALLGQLSEAGGQGIVYTDRGLEIRSEGELLVSFEWSALHAAIERKLPRLMLVRWERAKRPKNKRRMHAGCVRLLWGLVEPGQLRELFENDTLQLRAGCGTQCGIQLISTGARLASLYSAGLELTIDSDGAPLVGERAES